MWFCQGAFFLFFFYSIVRTVKDSFAVIIVTPLTTCSWEWIKSLPRVKRCELNNIVCACFVQITFFVKIRSGIGCHGQNCDFVWLFVWIFTLFQSRGFRAISGKAQYWSNWLLVDRKARWFSITEFMLLPFIKLSTTFPDMNYVYNETQLTT